MTLARELFEQVRTPGRVKLNGMFIRDCLPFVYTGESEDGEPYHNSGGRSVLLERHGGAYKLSGVDPQGHLTRRVADSPKNMFSDVELARERLVEQEGFKNKRFNGKPFGVFTFENTENAKRAFSELNEAYRYGGLETPCEFVSSPKIDDESYQIVFKLPQLESDLRVYEFMRLAEARLGRASRDEISDKLPAIKRIFGRFAAWTGYTMFVLASRGLTPTESSWAPQNFVLHRIGDSYGAYRVDHTSTRYEGQDNVVASMTELVKDAIDQKAAEFPFYQFTFIPEAAIIAAEHPEMTDSLHVDKSLSPFQRVIAYYANNYGKPTLSLGNMRTFMQTYCATGPRQGTELLIPEEYFRKVLE